MTIGDRVCVVLSGHQGEVVGFQEDGVVLVRRDDLPPQLWGPLPYDREELVVITAQRTA